MSRWSEGDILSRRRALAVLAAAPVAWPSGVAAQGRGTVEGIASQLICQCGCGKLLNVCEMDTARQMRSIISDKLGQGWDAKRIIAYMTDTYGEKVLAAPTKKGFNLTAWVTPFAVILAGAAVIWIAVGAWVRARAAGPRPDDGETMRALESRYGALLDEELDYARYDA